MEQALGIRLTLVAQLGNAAREVSGELNAVADSLKAVRDLGKQFSLDGITQLNKEVTSLNQRASAAAKSVGALTQNLKEAEAAGNAAASGSNAAASAAERVRAAASAAAQSVIKMGDAMSRAKEQGSALTILHTGFDLIEGSAANASRQVNNLADAVLRLAGAQRLALPGESAYAPRYGPIPQRAYYNPAFIPLPGGAQYALPSGDGPRYAPIPQPAYRSSATAALTGAEMLALSGGTDPNFNARAWFANQRAQGTSEGSGPAMSVPPGGFGGDGGGGGFGGFFSGASGGMKKIGDQLQSTGWALAINGGMLAAALVPAIKSAMDIDDLLHRTYEALKAGGATEAAAQQFSAATRAIPREIGSNYRETVSGGYNFISAMPSGLNLNDPKTMQAVIEGYKRTAMMVVAGSSSTHQVSMEEGALDVNNVIANLGLDTSSPQKLAQAYRTATNLLINLKNRTSTEIDMAAQSIKGIGPIAKEMGVDPAEIAALIGMEAEGKVRGATAGYAIKRLLQRQSVPSAKTEKLINLVNSMGGNIALFDKDGKTRSLLDVMSDTTQFEDTHHLTAQNKALIQGQLAGLYAVGNLDLMQDQIRRHGGAAGARAYGESLMHGTIAGGKTGDALTDAYDARSSRNFLVLANKVGADVQDTAFKEFKDIQPFLTSMLKGIDGLINAFDRLPTPVKSALSEMLILGTMFSVIAGGAAILIGNFIKFGGVVMDVVGIGGKVIGWLSDLSYMWGITDAAVAAFGTAVEVVGGVLTTIAGIISLPVVAIAALVAAIGLGAVAWVKDWGGIREKTAAVIQWIVQEIPKIPEQLGYMVGRAAVWLLELDAKWINFWTHFPQIAYNGIKFVVGYLIENVPKWADAGLKAISAWGNAILKALPGIGKAIEGGIVTVLNALNPVTWVKAGAGLASNFVHGVVQGYKDGTPQIKQAQQKLRDLHPGSEPKDSSSPLYGMGKSGQAFSDNFINGVLDGFRNGTAKVKHGAKRLPKAIADAFIDLRGESVAEVIKTAKAIEDVLTQQGAVIKNKWMDLITGGHVTRFYGDPAAVHQAIKQDKGPDPLKNATDYLKRLGEYPQTYQQIMSRLHTWLNAANAAELTHEVSTIDALISRVQKAHDAALAKLSIPFSGRTGTGGVFGQIEHTFKSEADKGNSFDTLQQKDDSKLQRMIELRKNKELPTLTELRKEREFEITERDALQKIYNKEIEQRATLISEINDALEKAQQINATDQQSQALKAKLLAQAQSYQDALDNLNGRLEDQQVTLTKLNGTIAQYTAQIKGATDVSQQWATILSGAFAQAGNDALKSLGDSLMNGLDGMLSRVFGAKRKGIAGIVGSFLAEAFSNVFSSLTGMAEKQLSNSMTGGIMSFFSRLFHVGGNSAPASSTNPLQGALDAGNSTPQQVQLTTQTGTDLSQPIADGIKATADGVSAVAKGAADAASTAKATQSNSASATDPLDAEMQKFLNSNLGKSIKGIAGAYAGYEMATAPGANPLNKLMGGLATYSSISSMPGGGTPIGQGIAIAAGLFTMFSHSDNPSKMPDKYDTQQYGSLMANLVGAGFNGIGAFNANGQAFREDPSMNQQLGGKGDLAYISAWIQANPAQAIKLLGQATVTMLTGASGITASKDGNVTLNNGQTVNWQTLGNAATQATNAIMQFGNNALSASQDAARLAASFTSLILGGPAGFSIPLLVGQTGLGGTINGSGSSLPGQPTGAKSPPYKPPMHATPISKPINVSILQGATITPDIAAQIQAVLPQVSSAITSAVNRSNYQQQRLYGDYVSAVA